MKLNKRIQYSLLFVFYLGRAGRANIETISKNLSVPKNFLDQIARDLRMKGLVKSVRGPGGGYELIGSPTISSILKACNGFELLPSKEYSSYALGGVEHRSLAFLVTDLNFYLAPMMNRTAKDVVRELVRAESHKTDSAKIAIRAN